MHAKETKNHFTKRREEDRDFYQDVLLQIQISAAPRPYLTRTSPAISVDEVRVSPYSVTGQLGTIVQIKKDQIQTICSFRLYGKCR